jgi:hypothetical protein
MVLGIATGRTEQADWIAKTSAHTHKFRQPLILPDARSDEHFPQVAQTLNFEEGFGLKFKSKLLPPIGS